MRATRPLAIVAAAAFVLGACGGDDDSAGDTTAAQDTAAPETSAGSDTAPAAGGEPTKVAIITSGAANDLGWNQGIISSAESLQDQGVIELTVVQQGYDITAAETVRAASDLAEAGNRVVIAHSFNYGDPLKTMIADYPDVLFAYAGGFGDNTENLADYEQPFYESAFLAGILAGGISESGVVGGTGGFDIPVCHAMIAAFAEGAKLSYDGEVKLLESYIGSWGDAAKTAEAVRAMADQGADVFIPCGVDAGTIEGAKATDTAVIGYVMDQTSLAPGNVLASVVWNLDEVIAAMVSDVTSGAAPPAPYYQLGFQEGGTSVAVNAGFPTEIPADVMAIYEEYEAKMASGEFTVPYIPE